MIAALLLATALTTDPCPELRGGPAEGMCVDGEGPKALGMSRLLPAGHGGAPIAADVAAQITSVLRAYDRGQPVPAEARTADATEMYCADFAAGCPAPVHLAKWQLPAGFTHNAPYGLSDGRIRIEWMRGGKLAYLSLITLREGRIGAISTAPAEIPMMRR